MPTATSQFTVILTGDSICTVSTRSNHTPPSTPVRRAALGAMSSNELGDLTRVQIAAGKGRKTSIVGAGESMKALREAQDLAAAAQTKMVDAAVKQAMGPFEVQMKKQAEQMKEQAEEMRRMKLALGVADARLDGIEREKALELRPLLLLGVVCYVNSKIVGAKPTEVDESSNHSEKLQKLVAERKGLITSNSALRELLSQEKVMQITSLLDVKERHYLAHPDLQPGLMLRKLFLLERAMLEVGDKKSEVVTDLLKVVLLVTPMKDRRRWIKEWEDDVIIGWQKYNPEQIRRFVDFI